MKITLNNYPSPWFLISSINLLSSLILGRIWRKGIDFLNIKRPLNPILEIVVYINPISHRGAFSGPLVKTAITTQKFNATELKICCFSQRFWLI